MRYLLPALLLPALVLSAVMITAAPARADDSDPWPELQTALFPSKTVLDGGPFMHIVAPARAYDAAVVPVDITFDPAGLDGHKVRTITLVIDKNPAPLAAIFHLSAALPRPDLSTRVRVDAYTKVHAIAELDDGRLFMAQTFVKAAGGCSAPAAKDAKEAAAHIGEMKLKLSDQGTETRAQVLIRHPNSSGMQMDQLTRYYIPAKFLQTIRITYGGQEMISIEGNISLSENPSFEFWLRPAAGAALAVKAEDSDGGIYSRDWPVPPAG